jgi:hypothetical protein
MKSPGLSKPKWIRLDNELEDAVEDEQILLQRAAPGAKISFSDALRSLAIKGYRGQRLTAVR